MILTGVFCLALFIPAGCSVNSGDVELYDSSVTVKFEIWFATSGVENNRITFECSNKNISFECYAEQGEFNWRSGLKAIKVNANETFYWNDHNMPASKEIHRYYIDVIKRENEKIAGYAVIGIDYLNDAIYSPCVVKNVKFLAPVSEQTVNALIAKTKKR